MDSSLEEQFIQKLEEKYGTWSRNTSMFGNTPFGKIAKDLSMSASQFSKLLYGTATDGMYTRSIENINRLIQRESIKKELEITLAHNKSLEASVEQLQKKESSFKQKLILSTLFSLVLGLLGMHLYKNQFQEPSLAQLTKHPLSAYFDLDFDATFDSPYLNVIEVQEYCPCSAYEGVWSLSGSYKLPLPGSKKPGVYYVARSADVRMKCSKYEMLSSGKGSVLQGYEYLVNEIWVDSEKEPLSPRYFDKISKTFTPEFDALVFDNNPQFKKVADIHSFFIDKFEIHKDSIVRKGEPCGRFASDIDEALAAEFEIDIKHVLENVLGNLTTANCSSTANPFCDPNDLQEKESIISFDCRYTIKTENLGIGGGYPYQKGYLLEKQNYSDNLTCSCDE